MEQLKRIIVKCKANLDWKINKISSNVVYIYVLLYILLSERHGNWTCFGSHTLTMVKNFQNWTIRIWEDRIGIENKIGTFS